MAKLTIALFQNNSVVLDPEAQCEALRLAAQNAAMANAGLLITPELYMSGYKIPGAVQRISEPQDGDFLQSVSKIARDAGIAILCGYPERSADGVYNSAALVGSDGSPVLNHRKLHLSGPYEKEHFIVDNKDVQVANVNGVTVAPLICYDVEFPEAVRAAALAGAELVAVPTALVDQFAFLTRTLIPTRAFENGIFVAYANHAGSEADLSYCGLSTVARPDGSFKQAESADEALLIVSIDTDEIAGCRARLPYLTDRRGDLVGNI
jgi:predicted amidohydrolase